MNMYILLFLLTENPCEGSYCAYWDDEEGGYRRAQVMKFSQPLGLYFHHKEQARVSKDNLWPL